jgi:ankyrin repeat protein
VLIHVQDGKTPLYIASQKGHGAVVKLLLEQHSDVSICMKVMWLHRSSMCFYDFTILLQDGWTPTPLMAASFNGHADVVQTLIEAKQHTERGMLFLPHLQLL